MKTIKLMLCLFGFALLFAIAAANAADAPKLTFNFTKANVPGEFQTLVAEINNNGVMVGEYQDAKGYFHGYILDGKKLTRLNHPKGKNTGLSGINFNGPIKVVGSYTNSNGNSVGFRYMPATKKFTDIPSPKGATSSYTGGMNDQGWIAGYYTDSSNNVHGFLLQGTKYTILDVPGATATYAYGINNKGDITLTWVNSSGAYEGALYNYNAKSYTTIKVPGAGATGSEASFINNQGDITFWWFDSSGTVHGALFVHAMNKFYKFDYPKAVGGTYPNGINDENALVGQYQHFVNGPVSSFKATFK
ncbi:MAG: hypothetical protein WB711_01450 [Terriglobales bacterium]